MTHTATLGTVSHGTLRPEDLLESFAYELRQLGPRIALLDEYDALPDDPDEWTEEQQETASELVNDMIDALNEHAPAFCYFGAHPGDGSDFGFWFDYESFEDSRRFKECVDLNGHGEQEEIAALIAAADVCYACFINDHGNVTIYGADGTILIEVV